MIRTDRWPDQPSLISRNICDHDAFSSDRSAPSKRHGDVAPTNTEEAMIRKIGCLVGLVGCLALPCVAGAQNPQPAPPNEPHPSVAPPSASQPPPEQIAPGAGHRERRAGATLATGCRRQQGTLQPPAVDPGIRAPAALRRPGDDAGDTAARHTGRQPDGRAEITSGSARHAVSSSAAPRTPAQPARRSVPDTSAGSAPAPRRSRKRGSPTVRVAIRPRYAGCRWTGLG